MDKMKLVEEAISARELSYCPYSGFAVGAALLARDGRIFRGANIENASYGAALCAERAALSAAVMAGAAELHAIAIVGAPRGEAVSAHCPPCGICRQVLFEFCDGAFEIITYDGKNIKSISLGELLPECFKL